MNRRTLLLIRVAGLLMVVLGLILPAQVQAQTPTTTTLLSSGSTGQKKDLVIIGDGFQAGTDQTTFNNWVTNQVINGVFARGPFWEDMNAFNIYRVNTFSQDSGNTRVDAQGNVTTARNTALGYRVSGLWNRCWNEPGPNTNTTLNNILNNQVPGWEFVIIVLNDPMAGGCRRGNTLAVSVNGGWNVLQHEMGHMIGNLCDEYVGGGAPGNYTGSEPGCVNLTTNTDRDTLKWGDFVDPGTALPTVFNAATMDPAETAGAFEGGTLGTTGYSTGIWRPTFRGAMNDNREAFGPVCYNRIKEVLDQWHRYNYLDAYTGDFDGDDRADVMIQNANSIALYLSAGNHMRPTWIATGDIPGWDGIREHDRFFVGDFNEDNRDDLFVVNFDDWSIPYLGMLRSTGNGFESVMRYDLELPGWDDMRQHDQFYVGDFDGDGKDDLYVFNGRDWDVGYLIMLRSTGNSLQPVRRYDDTLPGWDSMLASDQFYVADFNEDNKEDLYVFNGRDWVMGYLMMLRSTGNSLQPVRRYDDTLPGWDSMRPYDQFYVADFDANQTDDLYVFNGRDWVMGYLMSLGSTGSELVPRVRYDDIVPGWDRLMPGDIFYVADLDGNKRQDLYVFNHDDWAFEYLGLLIADGKGGLTGFWHEDWVNSWNLGTPDQFLVGNFNGGSGWDDLFVRNENWLGLLRSRQQSVTLDAIYPKWIHDHLYHRLGWW
jgi:hypothetical protein